MSTCVRVSGGTVRDQGKQRLDCELSLFENGGIMPKGSLEEELVGGGGENTSNTKQNKVDFRLEKKACCLRGEGSSHGVSISLFKDISVGCEVLKGKG